MCKLFKKQYQRFILKQFKKMFNSSDNGRKFELIDEIFNLIVVSGDDNIWLNYLLNNENSPSKLISNLKKSLDEESLLLVDRFIRRNLLTDGVYYNPKKLFSDEELKIQQITHPEFRDFPYKEVLYREEESVFVYHCGIKLLPEEIQKRIEGKDIIDGGAYIGDSAATFLDYKPNKIYCFEPCEDNFQVLQKNIDFYNWNSKIIPVKMGIGSEKVLVKASGAEVTFSVTSGSQNNICEIQITDIDSFVRENNVDLGLIKLDIEGYELEAIRGAIESIKKYKPILLISIYHCFKDFFEIKPLLDELDLGYKFMIRKLNNTSLTCETMLIGYI